MSQVLLPFPTPIPTYYEPCTDFTEKYIRRKFIPLPRSPFFHFAANYIDQQIAPLENSSSHQKRVDGALNMWNGMSDEERIPWNEMTAEDIDLIARCVTSGQPVAADYLAYMRRVLGPPVRQDILSIQSLLLQDFEQPSLRDLPMIAFDKSHGISLYYDCSIEERRQDNPPNVFGVMGASQFGLPYQKIHMACYPTPPRFTYQHLEQDTNHSQHDEEIIIKTEIEDDYSHLLSDQVETTFLEEHRKRYSTPLRSTYHALSSPGISEHASYLITPSATG